MYVHFLPYTDARIELGGKTVVRNTPLELGRVSRITPMNMTQVLRPLPRVWEWITAPHLSIVDIEQRRQSRLLATVVIALTALVAATAIRQVYLNVTWQDNDWNTVLATTLEVVTSLPIIYFNH